MAALPDVPGAIAAPVGGGLVAAVIALWKRSLSASSTCDERIERALAPLRARIADLEARCDNLAARLANSSDS